jgi:hypothetical protein
MLTLLWAHDAGEVNRGPGQHSCHRGWELEAEPQARKEEKAPEFNLHIFFFPLP